MASALGLFRRASLREEMDKRRMSYSPIVWL
jgi:hypothetical protein